jgi:DNA-directed RNA polymerase subunit M/transcription elongation factor TFIIS
MDNEHTGILVSMLQLYCLTNIMQPQTTPLSPLAFFNIDKQDDDNLDKTLEELQELSLLTADKKLSPEVEELFTGLTKVPAVVKIMTEGSPPRLDIAIYPVDNKYTVFLQESPESFRIISQVPFTNLKELLSGYFGSGNIAFSDLNINNSIENLLIFSALVDIRRKQLLSATLNSTDLKPGLIHKAAISSALNPEELNCQWLTSVSRDTLGVEKKIEKERVDAEIPHLTNYVAEENNALLPLAAVNVTAGRFLIIENIITVETYSMENDTLNSARFNIIKSGFSDLMLIEKSTATEGRMIALTQNNAVELIAGIIKDPKQLNSAEDISTSDNKQSQQPAEIMKASIQCTKCSSIIPENVKFCPECGIPMQKEKVVIKTPEALKQVVQCPKCKKARLKAADKFCRTCGYEYGKEAS